jgi:4a-hydroxytetrahydrobiopterin dehydratase
MELKEMQCAPCEEGTQPFGDAEIEKYRKMMRTKWEVVDKKKIQKEFQFEDFKRAMAFVQNLALVAEKEDHHPDVCISYNKVNVELSTHSIGGLSLNDFILAAKIDEL